MEKDVILFMTGVGGSRHKAMIICDEYYAIFDLEELMMLMRQPVRCQMRSDEEEFRKIHDL